MEGSFHKGQIFHNPSNSHSHIICKDMLYLLEKDFMCQLPFIQHIGDEIMQPMSKRQSNQMCMINVTS